MGCGSSICCSRLLWAVLGEGPEGLDKLFNDIPALIDWTSATTAADFMRLILCAVLQILTSAVTFTMHALSARQQISCLV